MHFLAALILATAVAGGPVATDVRLLAELDRLDALLTKTEAAGVPKELSELVKIYRDALDKARAAKTPATRLYRMRGAYSGIESLAYLTEQKEAGKDLAAFTAFWNANRARFEKPAPSLRGSFLERALQESATNRAEKVFRASLPYAKVDAATSGIYYVSDAEGNLRFREFVRGIASSEQALKPPSAARLAKALDALQGEAIQTFEKEPTGRTLLAGSSKLKETRELLDAKRLEAATLSLLETRYELSKRAPQPGKESAIVPDGGDPVIALWNEIAGLESADNSRIIRGEVIPLYMSLRKGAGAPAAVASRAPVTVTLVRWPYT